MVKPASQPTQSPPIADAYAEVVAELVERLERDERIDSEGLRQSYPEYYDRLQSILPAMRLLTQIGRCETPTSASSNPLPLDCQGQLGDFLIYREIGRGGMGVVYEAEQVSLGRRVALKILPLTALLNETQRKRFYNEARAAATLKHPNTVGVHAVGSDRGVHYYAMEMIEGCSLAEVILQRRQQCQAAMKTSQVALGNADHAGAATESGEPSRQVTVTTVAAAQLATNFSHGVTESARRVAQIGQKLAAALEYAHQQGIVHRDVKPANILLNADSEPFLADFGLARVAADATLTGTGDFLGTLRYMSPEQATRGHVADHRSDIYSLGATLYELATMQPVFDGENRAQILQQITTVEARPLRAIDRGLPIELETILAKALEKDPADRYASAAELADDFGRFLNHRPIMARPASFSMRARKWCARNRALVATTAGMWVLLAVTATIGMLATLRALRESERRRGDSDHSLRVARQSLNDMYLELDRSLDDEPRMQLLQRQLLQKAAGFYEDLATRHADDASLETEVAEAFRRVGEIHQRLGEYPEAERALLEAIRRFEDLVQAHSDSADHMASLARGYDSLGRLRTEIRVLTPDCPAIDAFRRAVEAGKTALKLAPENREYQKQLIRSMANLARRLGYTQQTESALLLLDDALSRIHSANRGVPASRQDKLLEASVLEAISLFRPNESRYRAEAQSILESYLTVHPHSADARLSLALCLRDSQSPDLARAHQILTVLMTEFPDVPLYRKEFAQTEGLLAYAAENEGDYQDAKRLYDASLRDYALAWEATPVRGYRDFYTGRFFRRHLYFRGLFHANCLHDLLAARRDFETFIQKAREDNDTELLDEVYLCLGCCKAYTGRLVDSLADCERAYELSNQQLSNAELTRADVLAALGRYRDAFKIFQTLRAARPTRVTRALAWNLVFAPSPYQDLPQAKALLEQVPQDVKRHSDWQVGGTELMLGHVDSAIAHLAHENCECKPPIVDEPERLLLLSVAYARSGNEDAAMSYYLLALEQIRRHEVYDEDKQLLRLVAMAAAAIPGARLPDYLPPLPPSISPATTNSGE